jgi:hypothetical protein
MSEQVRHVQGGSLRWALTYMAYGPSCWMMIQMCAIASTMLMVMTTQYLYLHLSVHLYKLSATVHAVQHMCRHVPHCCSCTESGHASSLAITFLRVKHALFIKQSLACSIPRALTEWHCLKVVAVYMSVPAICTCVYVCIYGVDVCFCK